MSGDAQEQRDEEVFSRAYRALKDTHLPVEANPLLDPLLLDLSQRIVASSRGPEFGPFTILPYTWWRGVNNHGRPYWWDPTTKKSVHEGTAGAVFRHRPGRRCPAGTVLDVLTLLRQRTLEVAKKGDGLIVHFSTNPSGARDNESTDALHALVFDCDGRGEWETLLCNLEVMGVGYIAYQSGGWTPECPKWRVVLPLATPYDCRTEAAKRAWNDFYHRAALIFGSLAQLRYKGFDRNTNAVANNWYLTERRSTEAPPREVRHHDGASLDLVRFALGLPEIEERVRQRSRGPALDIEESGITAEERELLIFGLSEILDGMRHDRRLLCFHLADALVDYGIPIADVYDIIEELWSSYAPEVQEAAKRIVMQVEKGWEDGSKTMGQQSGALKTHFPEAMEALELALPDRVADRYEAWLARQQELADEFSDFLNRKVAKPTPAVTDTALPPGVPALPTGVSPSAPSPSVEPAVTPPRPPPWLVEPRPPASLVPTADLASLSGCRDLPAAYYGDVINTPLCSSGKPLYKPLPRSIEEVRLCREIAAKAKLDAKTKRIGETIELMTDCAKIPGNDEEVDRRIALACAYLGRKLPGRIPWSAVMTVINKTLLSHPGANDDKRCAEYERLFLKEHAERIEWEQKAPDRLEARLVKKDKSHAAALVSVLSRCPGGSQRNQ